MFTVGIDIGNVSAKAVLLRDSAIACMEKISSFDKTNIIGEHILNNLLKLPIAKMGLHLDKSIL